MSLDEAERATRIRARFLDALERGDFSGMASVQMQGFLRNYARFLGLDLDLLFAEFDAQPDHSLPWRKPRSATSRSFPSRSTPVPLPYSSRSAATAETEEERPRPRRRSLSSRVLIVLAAGVMVVAGIFGITRVLNDSASAPGEVPAESITSLPPDADLETQPAVIPLGTDEALLVAPPTENAGQLPGDAATPGQTEEPVVTLPTLSGDTVVLSVQVMERTWMRVTVDGEVAREGVARPGEVWQFEGNESVAVRASNAIALQLTVNNQPQGILGERGQLVDQTYTLEGVAASSPAPPDATAAPLTSSGDLAASGGLDQGAAEAGEPSAASPEPATLFFTATAPPMTPSMTPTITVTLPLLPGPGAESGDARLTPTPTAGTEPVETEEATGPPLVTESATEAAEPITAAPTEAPLETATEPATAAATEATTEATPATAQPDDTATVTRTPPPTATPTATRTLTRTPSPTPSRTPSATPTATRTPSPTLTVTPTVTPSPTPFLPPRITRTPSPPPK